MFCCSQDTGRAHWQPDMPEPKAAASPTKIITKRWTGSPICLGFLGLALLLGLGAAVCCFLALGLALVYCGHGLSGGLVTCAVLQLRRPGWCGSHWHALLVPLLGGTVGGIPGSALRVALLCSGLALLWLSLPLSLFLSSAVRASPPLCGCHRKGVGGSLGGFT